MSRELAGRRSGARMVYEVLRDRITSGEIPPGTRLQEPNLARSLGVSRTPVREALRLLTAEGLVEQLPMGGTIVAPLDRADAMELYEVRAVLEGLVARQAAGRLTDADVADLTQLVDLTDRLVDIPEEVLRLGRTFHTRIEEVAGNRRCSAQIRQLRGLIDRYRSLSTHEKGRSGHAAAEHRRVLDALRSKNPDAAEAAMRAHVLSGAQVLASALQRARTSGDQAGGDAADGPGGGLGRVGAT